MSDEPTSSLRAVCFYFGAVSAGVGCMALTVALHDRPKENKTVKIDPCEMITQPQSVDENRAMKMLECGLRHGFALRHP
ncbi:MAG: hypothetical protein NDJ24_00480 [Alphaproteobacteria bacterium]|nr:hypothetical protein [Alphaproteobacteria bacterium]